MAARDAARRAAPRRLRPVRDRAPRPSSATPPSCACASRARERRRVSSCATSATASRAVSRRSSTRRPTTDVWWRAEFAVANPVTRYRWLLSGRDAGYALGERPRQRRARGRRRRRLRDRAGRGGPTGTSARSSTRSSPTASRPPAFDGRRRRLGDPRATGTSCRLDAGRTTPRELFGGDLRGIEQHLDHIESLGANVIYLTPFFPAGSTHRYDATDVRPRRPAARRRRRARLARCARLTRAGSASSATSPRTTRATSTSGSGGTATTRRRSAASTTSTTRFPAATSRGSASRSLPKLDWRSDGAARPLRATSCSAGSTAVGLDGWRVDVANMTGRYRRRDVNHEVARMRCATRSSPTLLVAEHGHDFRRDLTGDGWHGVMNYAGFLRPVWTWLRATMRPSSGAASGRPGRGAAE